jgi:NADH:ubiquinone oxidoreductase subunit 4 (subunit M)
MISTISVASSTLKQMEVIALSTSIVNLFVSFIIFLLFDCNSNQFQFVQEYHGISSSDFYLRSRWYKYILCTITYNHNAYSTTK